MGNLTGAERIDNLRELTAKEIRDGAAIDIELLIAVGDLTRKAAGWYEVRDRSTMSKVSVRVTEMYSHEIGDKVITRVKLGSDAEWKQLAALWEHEYGSPP